MSETKVCKVCGKEKSLDQYSWRNKKRGRKHGHCKVCHSAYRKQHYQTNQEKYLEMVHDWNQENSAKRRDANRRYVFEYLLKHPCVDCGETHPIMLEFDHVRGKKRMAISQMLSSYSIDSIQKEIEKCEIRCANCHRRKTAKENGWHIIKILAELQNKDI